MLIAVALAVSVSVVTTILLIQKHGSTWNLLVPVVIFAVVVPATLGVVANYLYWRARYRVRHLDIHRKRFVSLQKNLKCLEGIFYLQQLLIQFGND